MCWEGPTYEDYLGRLKVDGVFPLHHQGLTSEACYDMERLLRYALARVGKGPIERRRFAKWAVDRINAANKTSRVQKLIKPWAQKNINLRFLQWTICQVCRDHGWGPQTEADVIDYVTMELVGTEFIPPPYPM